MAQPLKPPTWKEDASLVASLLLLPASVFLGGYGIYRVFVRFSPWYLMAGLAAAWCCAALVRRMTARPYGHDGRNRVQL